MSGVAENKRMRRRIIKILKPLHACAVENSACPGYPDVEFKGGHLENKELKKWPREGEVIKLPHFTQDQRLWLQMRNRAGGFADICLKVGQDWYLLKGDQASHHLGVDWTREDIEQEAYVSWKKRLDEKKFLEFFIRQK